jgi:asparagine synthase (glutamine-hydrolysing)
VAGIAGWVDLGGQVVGEQAVAGRMLDALAHRGAWRGQVWQDDQAAIGYRGRAGCVRQPVAWVCDERRVALACDGTLTNGPELRAELTARGRPAAAATDPECMLLAYLEWGADFARHLHGEYGCALWDSGSGECLLIRDRLAVKPLYYALTPDGVLFGSEPSAVFAHPRFEPVVDADGLRELIAPSRAPAASVWRGLSEVPGATVLRVSRDGCKAVTYWQLVAREAADDLDATATELREVLDDIVRRQLGDAEPAACLLSGGLDSSSLAVLAAGQLRRRGSGRLRSFTVSFVGQADHFRPEESRPTPDAPFALEVARHADIDARVVELSVEELTDPAVSQVIMSASDRLPSQCDLSRTLYLLFRAVGEERDAVLSGDGADELLGMGPMPEAAAAGPGPTFPYLLTPGFPRFSVLRRDIERRLDVDAHMGRFYELALSQCTYAPGDSPLDRRMRESIYMYTLWDMNRILERTDRLAAATGIDVRHPFLDHRVIELTFNASYKLHTGDGREKSLLRSAMAPLLPVSVVDRKKSNLPTPQDAEYGLAIYREYLRLISAPEAPIFELADRRSLDWLSKDLGGKGSNLHLRRMRENVLALNWWLSVHGSSLRL